MPNRSHIGEKHLFPVMDGVDASRLLLLHQEPSPTACACSWPSGETLACVRKALPGCPNGVHMKREGRGREETFLTHVLPDLSCDHILSLILPSEYLKCGWLVCVC